MALCILLRTPSLLWFFLELRVRCVIPGGFIIIPPALLSLPHFWEEPQIVHAITCAAQNLKMADLRWEWKIEVKTVPGPLHSLPRRSLSFALPSQIYWVGGGHFWGSLHRKDYDPSQGCPPDVPISIRGSHWWLFNDSSRLLPRETAA